MEKSVIVAASYYTQKYFVNPEYSDLPTDIRNELRIMAIILSEKLHCILSVGFEPDGEIFFETTAEEGDFNYDDIGAVLEIKNIRLEQKELIDALQLWFRIYRFDK